MPTLIEFLRDELGCPPNEILSLGFDSLLSQYTAEQKKQIAQDFKKIKSLTFNYTNAGDVPVFHAIINNEQAPAVGFLDQKILQAASTNPRTNAVVLSPNFCIANMDSYTHLCASIPPEEAAAKLANAALWINNVLYVAALQERRSITMIDANPNASLNKLDIARRAKYQTELSFVFSDKTRDKIKDMLIAIMDYLNPIYSGGDFIHRVDHASLNWAEDGKFVEFASFAAEHKPYHSSRDDDESASVDLAHEFRRTGEAGTVELNGHRKVNAQSYVNRLVSILNSLEVKHELTELLAARLRAMLISWNSSTPYGSPRVLTTTRDRTWTPQFKLHEEGEEDLETYVVVGNGEESPATAASQTSTQTAESAPRTDKKLR